MHSWFSVAVKLSVQLLEMYSLYRHKMKEHRLRAVLHQINWDPIHNIAGVIGLGLDRGQLGWAR